MKPYTTTSTIALDNLAWRRLRQIGIGGSDAPHIALTPEEFRYCDPEKLLRDKIEPITEEFVPIPCRVGHALEPLCASLYIEATGRRVHKVNALLRSTEHPFMCANLDRKLYGVNEGLECKAVGWLSARRKRYDPETDREHWVDIFGSGDWETDLSYKPEWYIQMQHYMAVTGWAIWHLAVLVGNDRFIYYDIPRNDALIEQLITVEREFWDVVLETRAQIKARKDV